MSYLYSSLEATLEKLFVNYILLHSVHLGTCINYLLILVVCFCPISYTFPFPVFRFGDVVYFLLDRLLLFDSGNKQGWRVR